MKLDIRRAGIVAMLVAAVCASGTGCSRGGGGGAGIPGAHDGGASSAQPASSP